MRFSTARLVALALLFSAGASAQTAIDFEKEFNPSIIGPGSVTTLTFTIDNNTTSSAATQLAFTDTLPAGMTIASPSNASTTCTSGRGGGTSLDAPAGGTTISLSEGVLAPSSSCEVQVNVTSATSGESTNTSGDLTSSLGNSGSASADLTVDNGLPGFSKSFAPATVVLGGRSTLTFLIDNTANASAVPNLDFTDLLPAGMVVASPSNAATDCKATPTPGLGTTLTAIPGSGTITLDANGASFPAGLHVLAAGASCTVSVDVETTAAGALGNVTQDLQVNSDPAGKASAVLDVVASTLQLSKSFLQDPVPPGGTVPLQFTLRNISRDGTATGLTFSDDLDAALSGLLATGALPATVCNGGTLDSPDGGMTLAFSGGTLGVSESCTFEVDVTVPAGAATGGYTNTTSGIEGEVNGSPAAGSAATASLFVDTVPVLTKVFTDDPVSPGGDVTLEFTITNTSPDDQVTDLEFLDDLSTFLPIPLDTDIPRDTYTYDPFTVVPGGREDVCGSGSLLDYASAGVSGEGIQLTGGTVPAGGSCTFSVVITLPIDFPGGEYTNTTSAISATLNGATLVGGPATDVLSVQDGPALIKEFTDDPVVPGGTATLAFTLAFPTEGSLSASDVAFSDDLDATLTGLVATGLPVAACGGTLDSSNSGSTLDFTGGTLAPNEVCAFSVSVTVPGTASSGTYTNTTTALTSTVGGVELNGATASDDLVVTDLAFSKAFLDDPVAPGDDVTLEFTITNGSTSLPMTDIAFTDDLDAELVGLAATALPPSNVCGGTVSGSSLLSFSGGSLAAGETCAFSVTLSVPASTEAGLYYNATSVISATFNGGTISAASATDGLVVDDVALPTLTAAFAPAIISPNGISQLTLTIDNSESADPASALAVTATLAAGAEVASPANEASTCGGIVTAVAGGSSLDLSGGTVAAGATCTISVSVTSASLGMFLVNTTALSTSLGTSNTASAKLTVEDQVAAVTKADSLADADGDALADQGETIVYTVVIEPASTLDRTSTFTDTPDATTTLVPGSVVVDAGGTIVSGNAPGEGTVVVTFQDLAETATLTFEVTVNPGYTEETVEVCNQGTLSGDFTALLSNDPDVVGGGATCTALAPPNRPPVADAGEDQTLECTGPGGTTVTLDGSGSSDLDDDELTYSWAVDGSEVATGATPDLTLPTGTTVVTLTVTDPYGETDTDDVEVTVEDTTPPVITLNGAASVEVIRFSGAYVDPGATAEDACEGTVAVTASGTVDTTVPGVYTITYAAVDAAGNPAEATRTVTVVDDPAAIASAFLFLVEKDLNVDGQIRTEGDVHSNDKLEFKNGLKPGDGGPSLHVGNATASDDLKVHKDQRIEGDVRAPDVDLKNGAVVTGTVTEGPVAPVALPTVAVSASGADVDVANDGTLTLPPGSYGKLDLGQRAVLTLSTGTYTFEEIKMDDDARLEGDISAGPIEVNVEDKMSLKDDGVIVPTPFGEADARYLTFRVADGNVDLGKGAMVAAQIIAPESKVTIDKNTRFVGVVVAEKLDVNEGATALFVTAVPPVFVTALVAEGDRPAPDSEAPGSVDEEPVVAEEVATAVAPQSRVIPEVFALGTTYPNPMDRSARVRYDVPVASAVRLEVYDALGRQVAVLVDGPVEAGSHEAVFYAHRLPAGTYLIRFTSADGFAQTRPVTVLR